MFEHKGYQIRFNENDEKWFCHNLDLSNESLLKLRKAIDRAFKQEIATEAVRCIYFSYNGEIPATVTYVKSDFRKGNGQPFSRLKSDQPIIVWYQSVREGNNRPGRSSASIDNFCLPTPENMELLAEAKELDKRSQELREQAASIRRSVPRMSEKDIQGLVDKFRSEQKS